jgi:thiamine-phosphate pyrophosphorylase
MLIVVSPSVALPNEAKHINHLFNEGLELFHLRKPNFDEEEIKRLIFEINPEYYSKIAFHQSHHLAKLFNVNRLHYTTMNRKNHSATEITDTKKNLTHLSTSVHSYEEYEGLPDSFDYAFLGPVFDSISKKNYKAVDFKNYLSTNKKSNIKLIAIGGITKSNFHESLSWGFDGVAVSGSIWESKSPVEEFVQINEKWKNYATMF